MTHPHTLSRETVARAARLYATCADAARVLGMHLFSFVRLCKWHGISPPGAGSQSTHTARHQNAVDRNAPCQAAGCDRPRTLPATGDLCLSCWVREYQHGEAITRKQKGRGGGWHPGRGRKEKDA